MQTIQRDFLKHSSKLDVDGQNSAGMQAVSSELPVPVSELTSNFK